jgi:hypothetical protein
LVAWRNPRRGSAGPARRAPGRRLAANVLGLAEAEQSRCGGEQPVLRDADVLAVNHLEFVKGLTERSGLALVEAAGGEPLPSPSG